MAKRLSRQSSSVKQSVDGNSQSGRQTPLAVDARPTDRQVLFNLLQTVWLKPLSAVTVFHHTYVLRENLLRQNILRQCFTRYKKCIFVWRKRSFGEKKFFGVKQFWHKNLAHIEPIFSALLALNATVFTLSGHIL